MIVALLTDFGTRDHFVASVKGTILTVAPEVTIVDISHEIEPQNISEAVYTLGSCYLDFPKGTIFMAVVDPGVGSSRRAVAVRTDERYFVCPDNGILGFVLANSLKYVAHELTNSEYQSKSVSSTFHGRDIFAHAVGHFANGVSIGRFGPPVTDLQQLKIDGPMASGNGTVIHIDRFGNLITNLRPRDLQAGRSIEVDGRALRLLAFYSQAEPDEVFALVGSTGRIEISVNRGSASDVLGVNVGDEVRVGKPGYVNRSHDNIN